MTLVELLVIALPGLAILGLLLHLFVRSWSADRWQDARLAGLDAVLIASEHLRHDLASCRGGEVEVASDRLVIATGAGERATYTSAGSLRRDGRPLRAAPLSVARWSWSDEPRALVRVQLAADGARRITLDTQVHLPDRAARNEHPSWVP